MEQIGKCSPILLKVKIVIIINQILKVEVDAYVMDYQALHSVTIKDHVSKPMVDDLFDEINFGHLFGYQ